MTKRHRAEVAAAVVVVAVDVAIAAENHPLLVHQVPAHREALQQIDLSPVARAAGVAWTTRWRTKTS